MKRDGPRIGRLSMTFSIKDMPEVMADLRRELASILREHSDSEPIPTVQRRLREIAAVFECGQREDTHSG